MIIDQLRCGGVLEAVRVSRAGYQIKHLHDVFRARYSFLGDPQTRSNSTVRNDIVFGKKLNATNGEKSIKKLIEKIALDIWKVEHKAKSQHESSMPVTVSYNINSIGVIRVFFSLTTIALVNTSNHVSKFVQVLRATEAHFYHQERHFYQKQNERTLSKRTNWTSLTH